jgi:RNA polymerase sigma-70 factor (ECF subfamily)
MIQTADARGPESRPSTSTSRTLLDRVRARDAEAWERLVHLYAPLVIHWCRHAGVPPQDVADLVPEVFQAVAGHVAAFRKEREGDTFRGWLRRITQNKTRDYFRRRRHDVRATGGTDRQMRLAGVPDAPPDDASAEDAELGLLRRVLDDVRGAFEPHTWEAFWRTAIDGRAAPDVAAELGMSPGAVRVAKSRVLQRLREELGDLAG